MKIAILTANLGKFDKNVDPIPQRVPIDDEVVFHRFTDQDFPPITGLSPRLQYRIPKLFGWEMFPGYDYYLWLDGSMSLQNLESLRWFLTRLGDNDIAFFKHPWRNTMKEETDHIEKRLAKGDKYIVPRYFNGLHKEQLAECLKDLNFKDDILYASNVFIYKNDKKVQDAMKDWWYYQSRYYTCDQIVLPYVLFKNNLKVSSLEGNVFKSPYVSLISKHH